MRLPATVLLSVTLVAPAAWAQQREKIDLSKRGPQVGEQVPDFRLPDQTGKQWTRQSILGPKGAMLVFVRSADWCPYCKTQLVELNEQFDELKREGYGVATISYDPPEVLAAFAKQQGIKYTMLSDVGSKVIERFGLLNPVPAEAITDAKNNPDVAKDIETYVSVMGPRDNYVGIAFPGNLMLNPQGVVTSRFFEDSYIDRNTVSSILLKLGADTNASVNATKVETQHLAVTSYASNSKVAMGHKFSLVLDIDPAEHIHVYAPGAEKNGYRVIELRMEDNPDITFGKLIYPASEIYNFVPLNEHVPVFQKEFRLMQEATLTGGLDAFTRLRGKTEVTIMGTLRYQACDDVECFIPKSVPLEWKLDIRDLVMQRAQ